MKKIISLSGLLMEELADLLNVENQLVEVLPKMAHASQSLALKLALEAQLEITKGQASRLKDIYSNTGQNLQEVMCKTVKGFIQEGEYMVNKKEKGLSCDAAIVSLVQRVKQYEISGNQTACAHAIELG